MSLVIPIESIPQYSIESISVNGIVESCRCCIANSGHIVTITWFGFNENFDYVQAEERLREKLNPPRTAKELTA